ncbi:hypothetical protein MMC14_002697 [Varicellaria rhodocarpa]|nr:hypothetical protein [Varicellaria rhodocarpa]
MEHSNWPNTEEDPGQGPFYEDDRLNFNHSQVNASQSYDPLYGQSVVMLEPLPNVEYQTDTNARTYPNYQSEYDHAEPSSQNRPAESLSEGHHGMVYQGNNVAEDIPASTPLTLESARLSDQVPTQPGPNPLLISLQYHSGVAQYFTNEFDPWTPYSAGQTPAHYPHPGASQWPATDGRIQYRSTPDSQENQAMHINIASIPRSPPENAAFSNAILDSQQMDTTPYVDDSGNVIWPSSPHQKSPELLAEAPPHTDESEMYQVTTAFDHSVQPGLSTHHGTAPAELHSLVGNSPEHRPSLGNYYQLTGYVDSRPSEMQITDNEPMVDLYGQAGTRLSSPNGNAGQHSMSPSGIPPGKKKVKARRPNTRAQQPIKPRDNTPSENTSSIASGFQTLDSNMNLTSFRRKRKLSDDGKKHAKEMRKCGACTECRRKKCKCTHVLEGDLSARSPTVQSPSTPGSSSR